MLHFHKVAVLVPSSVCMCSCPTLACMSTHAWQQPADLKVLTFISMHSRELTGRHECAPELMLVHALQVSRQSWSPIDGDDPYTGHDLQIVDPFVKRSSMHCPPTPHVQASLLMGDLPDMIKLASVKEQGWLSLHLQQADDIHLVRLSVSFPRRCSCTHGRRGSRH